MSLLPSFFLSAVAFLLFFSGCGASQKRIDQQAGQVQSAVLPVSQGGAVGAKATGKIIVPSFSSASRKLCNWKLFTLAQPETEKFIPLGSGKAVSSKAQKLRPEAVQVLRSWISESQSFPEIQILLAEATRIKSVGVNLIREFLRSPASGEFALIEFRSERGPVAVLGQALSRNAPNQATLLEIHFFVEDSYKAGLNAYHLKRLGPDQAEFTVEIYCWISQAEGLMGLLPRKIAASHLRSHAEQTWRSAARYLSRAG